MKSITGILLTCLFSLSAFATNDLPNLKQVSTGIYRSGRPTEIGLRDMVSNQNLKTIINVEDSMANVQQESQWAKNLGTKYVSIPLSAFLSPSDSDIEKILNLLKDPSLQPILIHCQFGQDRTGLVIGLHRVFEEGWTPAAAYQEMLDLGFHTILFSLDRYYKMKTGYAALVPEASGF